MVSYFFQFNFKSSIPIGAKVEISPNLCFTLGVKAEIEKKKKKNLFNLPQVLINAELYGHIVKNNLYTKLVLAGKFVESPKLME